MTSRLQLQGLSRITIAAAPVDVEQAVAALCVALGGTPLAGSPPGTRDVVLGGRDAVSLRVTPGADGPRARLSLEWSVPLDAVASLAAHGVDVDEDGAIDAAALHGLSARLVTAGADPRHETAAAAAPDPIGRVGRPVMTVATADPTRAASALADLTGGDTYDVQRPQLNAAGRGVALGDHAVEFLASATSTTTDLVGRALAADGPGVLWLSLPVADLSMARSHLAGHDVRFEQYGRVSLILPADVIGCRIELTTAR